MKTSPHQGDEGISAGGTFKLNDERQNIIFQILG
jgi:hypothetical protein